MGQPIYKRVVAVKGRLMRFRHCGAGPVVIALHSSPNTSRHMIPLMSALSDRFCVLAPDMPGFGDSDPLPAGQSSIADLSQALIAWLDTLGIEYAGIFGTHTGAAVAAEITLQYPERVVNIVLDGLAIFSQTERADLEANYLPAQPPYWDGSHLMSVWTRWRDNELWSKWYAPGARHRHRRNLKSPTEFHPRILDILRTNDAYRAPYLAAALYDSFNSAGALEGPASFICRDYDPLYPHLDRLPTLKSNQQILRIGSDYNDYAQTIATCFSNLTGADTLSKTDICHRVDGNAGSSSYVDLSEDRQAFVRKLSGESKNSGKPVLLLHDGLETSYDVTAAMKAIGIKRSVFAVDVAGTGRSDPLRKTDPTLTDYADWLTQTLDAIGAPTVDIYGRGCGALLALALENNEPSRVSKLLLHDLPLWSHDERRTMSGELAPRITPNWAGTYLFETWQMLRDTSLFDPWFARTAEAIIAEGTPVDTLELHIRAVNLLRSYKTYHLYTEAYLDFDAAQGLKLCRAPFLAGLSDYRSETSSYRRARDLIGEDGAAIFSSNTDRLSQQINGFLDSV